MVAKLVSWTGVAIVFMLNSSARKTVFRCTILTLSLKPKRASFATQESLFFAKGGKVTFSAWKSLLCRYSALSLQSETDGRLPLSDSFFQSAFAVASLWVRFRRRTEDEDGRGGERSLLLTTPTKDREKADKCDMMYRFLTKGNKPKSVVNLSLKVTARKTEQKRG